LLQQAHSRSQGFCCSHGHSRHGQTPGPLFASDILIHVRRGKGRAV